MDVGGLHPAWLWLVLAVLLAGTELAISGVFLVWIAAAAALTAIVAWLLPIDLAYQLVLFGLLAIVAVFAGRRFYERNPVESSDPLLNDRISRMIGQKVTVVGEIRDGQGRVKVGDSVWTARGPDAPVGAQVTVVGAEGNCLKVDQPVPVRELPQH